MKGLRACFLSLCIFATAHFSFSQSRTGDLRGKIIDESGLPAEAVTIALLRSRDSLLIRSTISDKSGLFRFDNLKTGEYMLVFSKINYRNQYSKIYKISDTGIIDAGTVKLELSGTTLKEVVVSDRQHYIDVKHDKTTLNVERNILNTGVSAADVLRSAPGVKISSDGNIYLRPGQSASVFINGKKIELSGTDLYNYLLTLPSQDIQQIQLLQNPPARYDASGTGGAINIILKKGQNYGFNGSATATGGYGAYGKTSAAVNTNYRSNTVNIFANGGFNYNKTDHTINTDRNVTSSPTSVTNFNTHYFNTQSTPAFDYRAGADFFLDSAHTVGVLVYGNTSVSRFDKRTVNVMRLNGNPDSTLTTLSHQKRDIDNVNYNLNYSGTLGHTKQKLEADADYWVYDRRMYENIKSDGVSDAKPNIAQVGAKSAANIPHFNNDSLRNIAPTRYTDKSLKVDYTNPVSKWLHLGLGIKYSDVKTDNNQYFDVLNKGVYQPYPAFTSEFTYTEKLADGYVSAEGAGKKFSYSASLRLEHTTSDANEPSKDIHKSYTDLFPNVSLNYELKNGQISLDYNRRINRPLYENLNPIVYYQDNYTYRSGNAYLMPQYNQQLKFTYTSGAGWLLSVYGDKTTDLWQYTYFIQNNQTKALRTTQRNMHDMSDAGLSFNLPLKLTRWWSANFNTDLVYLHFKDDTLSAPIDKGTKDLIFTLDQTFSLPGGITASLHGSYESATYFGISNFKPAYLVNAGLSKPLFNKRATINFVITDLFNTQRDRAYTDYNNLDMTIYDKRETRVARLSFIYRFGKKTIKAAPRHITGNDEEQKRSSN